MKCDKNTTLSDIIKRFNINHSAVLKVDCEGCNMVFCLRHKTLI